ncbi:hypothetical protein PIB30_020891 [Stylosanthes scabra]|uniref:Auxin-induced protein n=1 Tax=Stylosanthes scabra TaxID=79078 RepID=A0ABU6XAG2_9FABA|nr:hypothetical protein [Stylosanthes scabra]
MMDESRRRMGGRRRSHHKFSEERELELRLGPPGEEQEQQEEQEEDCWSHQHNENKGERNSDDSDQSPLSLGYFSAQRIYNFQPKASSFLQNMSMVGKESKDATSSQPCRSEVMEFHNGAVCAEKKPLSSPSSANTAAPNNSSQKRSAAGPVVGWPPIRSFRKNNASGSTSKPPLGSHHHNQQQHHHHHLNLNNVEDKVANTTNKELVNNISGTPNKGMFIKINMDGIPIGRKVDINAYDSYDKLSSVVDHLFRDLLSAQRRNSCGAGTVQKQKQEEEEKTMILDGSGEYTLIYEDNEGDKMLVGDVPWHMFVSTVKRLRVLKKSDLAALSLGGKQGHINH